MIVCLDANCIIYLVEADALWGAKITARIAALRSAGHEIAVSDLSRTECLAAPFAAGDAMIIADYQIFFASPAIHILPLTAAVCERAARIRAACHFRLKTPDCLHLAAAIEHGCGSFLTNDRQYDSLHRYSGGNFVVNALTGLHRSRGQIFRVAAKRGEARDRRAPPHIAATCAGSLTAADPARRGGHTRHGITRGRRRRERSRSARHWRRSRTGSGTL